MNYIWTLCEWKGMNEKKATAIMHIGQYFYNWEKERKNQTKKQRKKERRRNKEKRKKRNKANREKESKKEEEL